MSAKPVTTSPKTSPDASLVSIAFDADMQASAAPVIATLEAAGDTLDLKVVEGLEEGLTHSKEGLLVALVPPAEHVVANALSKGLSPTEALEAWQDYAAVIIKRHRYYRTRTLFLDARYFDAHPKKAVKALQEALQVKLSAASVAETSLSVKLDPLFELIALGLLRSDPSAEKLRSFVEGTDACDATDRWEDRGTGLIEERQILRDSLDIAQTQIGASGQDDEAGASREDRLEMECQLLSEDIDHMQQRLEREIANTKMLQLSKDAAEKKLAKMAGQIQQREVVLAKALLAEGRRHDAILTSLRAEQAELLGRRDQLEQEVAERQAELQRVYASKSWRVTEPIRALRRSSSDS
ncbi:hypothetical protein [Shimia sp. MIT1388]|uniref:hypothetical protein n=1 Tax=Shimia sp. MIT1388 TaxID=3096992 RepID=UPI00399BB681